MQASIFIANLSFTNIASILQRIFQKFKVEKTFTKLQFWIEKSFSYLLQRPSQSSKHQ
jgi:hypothetical protein